MFGLLKWIFGTQRKQEVDDVELLIDSTAIRLDSCFYIAAHNGKDTVVNRRLQKRADELEKIADKLKAHTRNGRK